MDNVGYDTIVITPECDCDILVTLEFDGWGYAGELWEVEISVTASTLPTRVFSRTGTLDGHDTENSYCCTKAYYSGFKAGVSYTFSMHTITGQAGGAKNGCFTAVTY